MMRTEPLAPMSRSPGQRCEGWRARGSARAPHLLAALLGMAAVLATAGTASAAIYRVTDLGTLGGETSSATAINDAGEVTGSAETTIRAFPNGGIVSRAFRYRKGEQLTDLGPTEKAGEATIDSYGAAINSEGDVVGRIEYASATRAGIFRANGATSQVPCSNCYE